MTRNTIFMATWSPNRKIDCGNKIWKKTCLFTFSKGNLKMTASCLASFVNFVKVSKQQWNGSALLLYAIVISVQKLIQVTKSNTAGFLRIQRHNRTILKRMLAKTTGIDWDKDSICSEGWSQKISWLIMRTSQISLLLIPRF